MVSNIILIPPLRRKYHLYITTSTFNIVLRSEFIKYSAIYLIKQNISHKWHTYTLQANRPNEMQTPDFVFQYNIWSVSTICAEYIVQTSIPTIKSNTHRHTIKCKHSTKTFAMNMWLMSSSTHTLKKFSIADRKNIIQYIASISCIIFHISLPQISNLISNLNSSQVFQFSMTELRQVLAEWWSLVNSPITMLDYIRLSKIGKLNRNRVNTRRKIIKT